MPSDAKSGDRARVAEPLSLDEWHTLRRWLQTAPERCAQFATAGDTGLEDAVRLAHERRDRAAAQLLARHPRMGLQEAYALTAALLDPIDRHTH